MNVCSVKYLNVAAQQNVPRRRGASGYYQCENRRKRCVGGGRNGRAGPPPLLPKNPNYPIFNFAPIAAQVRALATFGLSPDRVQVRGSTHMVQYLKTRTIIYTSTCALSRSAACAEGRWAASLRVQQHTFKELCIHLSVLDHPPAKIVRLYKISASFWISFLMESPVRALSNPMSCANPGRNRIVHDSPPLVYCAPLICISDTHRPGSKHNHNYHQGFPGVHPS